jgi:hypothetical protein
MERRVVKRSMEAQVPSRLVIVLSGTVSDREINFCTVGVSNLL